MLNIKDLAAWRLCVMPVLAVARKKITRREVDVVT